MVRVFLSYRREDSRHLAGRVYDRLVDQFGKGNVFKDVDSIPLGVDFRTALRQSLGSCDVLVAIIGARWLDITDQAGRRRLEDPKDFVRIEIEEALARGIRVIPLLADGAAMPGPHELPTSLHELAYRQASPVRPDPDFRADLDRLTRSLEPPSPAGDAFPEKGRQALGGIGRRLLALLRTGRRSGRACPHCGAVDSLADDPDDPTMLHCAAGGTGAANPSCRFRILRRLSDAPRVTFTVCGSPGSGKTEWVIRLWDAVLRGACPPGIRLLPARCGDEERWVDEHLQQMTMTQRREGWTPRILSEAVYFEGKRRGWRGESSFLVSLLDFTGRELYRQNLWDYERQRAFLADGFVLFLDAPALAQESRDWQVEFYRFVEDFRRATAARKPPNVPLAVCINKVDALERACAAGHPFLEELRALASLPLTAGTQARRHRLCLAYADDLFRGMDLGRILSEAWGGRHLLIPLTRSELGAPNAENALPSTGPFGLFDPIAWLLEAKGLVRLPKGSEPEKRG